MRDMRPKLGSESYKDKVEPSGREEEKESDAVEQKYFTVKITGNVR